MGERPARTDREWTSLGGPVDVSPFVREVGPTFTVPEDPMSIFLALFTTELLNRVTAETNRFASMCLSASQQEVGSPSAWATTAEEMKAFLGFLVLIGIQKLPGLYDYWSTDEVFTPSQLLPVSRGNASHHGCEGFLPRLIRSALSVCY